MGSSLKKLQQEEVRREKLLQLILGILDVDPEMLEDFTESAHRELNFINKIINDKKIEDYNNLLTKIFRSMHLIKGNAKLLKIDYFAEKAHSFEEKITKLQKKNQIIDNDVIPLREELFELHSSIEEMERIIERMGQLHTKRGSNKNFNAKTLLKSLENLIKSFSSIRSDPV